MNSRSPILGPGAFRFVLALLVVVHHSFPLRMGAWAVYVFFILSGYWIAKMWEKKYSFTRASVLTFLVSRWWRLAPVFLFTTAVAMCLGGMRPAGGVSAVWVLRQLCIIGSVSAGHLLPPAWSLDVEAQFYLLAPLLLWVGNTRRSVLALATGFSFICFTYFACLPPQPGVWKFRMGVTPYLGFFLSGVEIYRRSWLPSKTKGMASPIVFVLATALFVAFPETRSGIWASGMEAANQWWHQLWAGIGALMMLPFIALNLRGESDHRDRFLGNWAYPLYLFHWLPRNWYYNHVDWHQPVWEQATLLTLNVLAAMAGSCLILVLLDAPLDRLRSRWVQSRLKYATTTPNDAVSLASWTGSSPS